MMNTTSPKEFWRAVILFVVILGSNRVIVTMQQISTNRNETIKVTTVWNRCMPSQHITEGKLFITW